jgi:adenylosuccinate lyase
VEADAEVTAVLEAEVIERCFDDQAWLTHVDEVIARLERLDP